MSTDPVEFINLETLQVNQQKTEWIIKKSPLIYVYVDTRKSIPNDQPTHPANSLPVFPPPSCQRT